VTLTCRGGKPGNLLTIPGTSCQAQAIASDGTASCSATAGTGAGQLHNNPSVSVTDPDTNLSNSGLVPFQIEGSTSAPQLPNCTASPNPAGVSNDVTLSCTGGAPGTQVTIPGSSCTPATVQADGSLTCTGKGDALGSNPPLTVTDPQTHESSEGTVPLTVDQTGPHAPVCTATPNPAGAGKTVTINCTVDADTTNTIPGATCQKVDATHITCTGLSDDLGSNPNITSTNELGNSTTAEVPLQVVLAGPSAPSCSASPSPAQAWQQVTLTCTVDAGTTNRVGSMDCATVGTTATCTASAGQLGATATVTSEDAAHNSTATQLSLALKDPSMPNCTATPGVVNAANKDQTVSISCQVDPGTTNAIAGATCDAATGASAPVTITCTGSAASGLLSNPSITSTDVLSHSSTNTVTLLVKTDPPNAPVCTATPSTAGANTSVTITCQVDAGTETSVNGKTCTTVGTTATCTGTGSDFGDHPSATSKDKAGNTSTNEVPLTVLTSGPTAPVCTASPSVVNAANADATVTVTCKVDAGTTNTVPGASCTPNPATGTGVVTITCTGKGTDLGSNPTVTSKDGANNVSTGKVDLIVKTTPPTVPVCTATPATASASTNVTITCTVEEGTTNTLQGGTCTPNPATGVTSITCSGTGGNLGSNPTITTKDEAGNTSTGTVQLEVTPGSNNNAVAVPTLSDWSLIALALMLLGVSGVTLRRSARR